jgi:hypothetical protein
MNIIDIIAISFLIPPFLGLTVVVLDELGF